MQNTNPEFNNIDIIDFLDQIINNDQKMIQANQDSFKTNIEIDKINSANINLSYEDILNISFNNTAQFLSYLKPLCRIKKPSLIKDYLENKSFCQELIKLQFTNQNNEFAFKTFRIICCSQNTSLIKDFLKNESFKQGVSKLQLINKNDIFTFKTFDYETFENICSSHSSDLIKFILQNNESFQQEIKQMQFRDQNGKFNINIFNKICSSQNLDLIKFFLKNNKSFQQGIEQMQFRDQNGDFNINIFNKICSSQNVDLINAFFKNDLFINMISSELFLQQYAKSENVDPTINNGCELLSKKLSTHHYLKMFFYIKTYNLYFKEYCDIQQYFQTNNDNLKRCYNLQKCDNSKGCDSLQTEFKIDIWVNNLNKNTISFGVMTKHLLKTDQILLFKQLCNVKELINDKENNLKKITSILNVLTEKDQQNLLVKLGHAGGEFIDEVKKALEKK